MSKPLRNDIARLIAHYPAALAAHGATPVGVLWPNAHDLATRFAVLLRPFELGTLAQPRKPRLLDLGCGPGFLLDYLDANDLLDTVDYTGVDVSADTIGHALERWPGMRFELRDIRDDPFGPDSFDYCLMCGVFTARFGNSYEQMLAFAKETLESAWQCTRSAISFNVMSKHVDWEREDLFHWPLDDIMSFCKARLSRHVTLQLDYGLWEAAASVSREARPPAGAVPTVWQKASD